MFCKSTASQMVLSPSGLTASLGATVLTVASGVTNTVRHCRQEDRTVLIRGGPSPRDRPDKDFVGWGKRRWGHQSGNTMVSVRFDLGPANLAIRAEQTVTQSETSCDTEFVVA